MAKKIKKEDKNFLCKNCKEDYYFDSIRRLCVSCLKKQDRRARKKDAISIIDNAMIRKHEREPKRF